MIIVSVIINHDSDIQSSMANFRKLYDALEIPVQNQFKQIALITSNTLKFVNNTVKSTK